MQSGIELRKKYFIDEKFHKELTEIEQIDQCLTFDELCEYFFARYDNNMPLEEKTMILQKLSSRIKHVENCKNCLSWCEYGYSLYNNICCNSIDFPRDKFFEIFKEDYKKYLEKREKLEEMCRQFGHNFDGWTYHEWSSIKNPTQREYEWYRECSRCGCIEKTKQNPVELKNTAYIRRK